mmetsp:Transcript_18054/g.39294  ORF Transcript_18054/g.39294 Transcript_18054/m.39294 type:complete len:191 (-) Transcript_18054:945-1517(-)
MRASVRACLLVLFVTGMPGTVKTQPLVDERIGAMDSTDSMDSMDSMDLQSANATFWSFPVLRRLIGSNCIRIDRGYIPPYYDCKGCITEEAQGCVDDMRANYSYNVPSDCEINSMQEHPGLECCPRITTAITGQSDLSYVSSLYPEAIRCIERSQCAGSVIYMQLVQECLSTCNFNDPRTGRCRCRCRTT